jgi:methionine-rich copper-binding protein CopC
MLLLGALAAGAPAFAHAFLDHAQPAVGSTLRQPPREVRIWFTQELEPAFSAITVSDEAGRRVDEGKTTIDPGDGKLLRIGLGALPAGRYKVAWRVVSVDTHATNGDFTFTVTP